MRPSLKMRVLSAAAALLAAGCTSVGGDRVGQRDIDVVGQPQADGMDPIAAAAYWGTRYDRDPSNPKVAVSFSRALRAMDNNEESLRVIKHASIRLGERPEILVELGKSLISNDRAFEAIRPLETAIANGSADDWSAYSALGVALDKIGRHKRARAQYDHALSLNPRSAQILNNKGLSYALDGRHRDAEVTLRAATTAESGTARVRQNLALVLALSGNTDEAEYLARSDLPPAVADRNVSYYRDVLSRPAYAWPDLTRSDVDLPDFGDDPASISMTPRATPVPEPRRAAPRPTRAAPPAKTAPAPQKAPTPKPQSPPPAEAKPGAQTTAATSAAEAGTVSVIPASTSASQAATPLPVATGAPLSLPFFRSKEPGGD